MHEGPALLRGVVEADPVAEEPGGALIGYAMLFPFCKAECFANTKTWARVGGGKGARPVEVRF